MNALDRCRDRLADEGWWTVAGDGVIVNRDDLAKLISLADAVRDVLDDAPGWGVKLGDTYTALTQEAP